MRYIRSCYDHRELELELLRERIRTQRRKTRHWKLRNRLLRQELAAPGFTITGGRLMFIVKADHADIPYSITPPESVTDSEGNPVPMTSLEYQVTSDNPAAVSVEPDSDEDPLTGMIHIGVPGAAPEDGLANINVLLVHDGVILGSFGAQFTIVPGDPAMVVGGGITFDGITEAENPGEPGTDIIDDEADTDLGDDEPLP
jgi:hypothetical protein